MARQTLDQWIAGCLVDRDKGGKCTALALVHMQGGQQVELHTKELPEKMPIQAAETYADEFEDIAKNYAAGLPGAQSFQMMAFYAGRKRAQAFRPWVERGFTELDGMATESPTATGILAQSMRHLEAKGLELTKGLGMLLDAQNDLIRLQAERERGLKSENIEMFGVLKDLIIDKAKVDNEAKLAALQYERDSEERRMLMKAGPGLINAAMGREVIPQSQEDSGHIEAIIDALLKKGPAALGLVKQLDLPPATAFALAARLQRGANAREAEADARRPSHDLDPEDDVNGGLQ